MSAIIEWMMIPCTDLLRLIHRAVQWIVIFQWSPIGFAMCSTILMWKLKENLCRLVLLGVHRRLDAVHNGHGVLLVTCPFRLLHDICLILKRIACRSDAKERGLVLLVLVQSVVTWPWVKRVGVWANLCRLLVTSVWRENHYLLRIGAHHQLVRDLLGLLGLHRLNYWFLKGFNGASSCC